MKNLLLLLLTAAIMLVACGKDEPKPYKGHWIVGTWILDSMNVEFLDAELTEEQKAEYVVASSSYQQMVFFDNGRVFVYNSNLFNSDVNYKFTSDTTIYFYGSGFGPSEEILYVSNNYSNIHRKFFDVARKPRAEHPYSTPIFIDAYYSKTK